MTSNKALLASLRNRPVPPWFDRAKFGIFVHWGVFSVPGFAPHSGKISEANQTDYDNSISLSPYSEWYANAIRVDGSPSAQFHAKTYGDRTYSSFKTDFEQGLQQWDPQAWAKAFKASGARYMVLVCKHHDGYCLWPSSHHNANEPQWFSQRDIVGELAAAVRAEGLRFGVYYSGGIDWTFNRKVVRTFGQFVGSSPRGDYPNYAEAQVRELIERYKPDVLWNDISWPCNRNRTLQLFNDYYAAVPDGVINDRWLHYGALMRTISFPPVTRLLDWYIKRQVRKHPESSSGVMPPEIAHSDFRTPEYTTFEATEDKKWETTRGMSHSYGYNRNDTESDYESSEQLLFGFIDSVSKNGNLLLNVGPRGQDAQIPDVQLQRLADIGVWLKGNASAIYGSRPWRQFAAKTDQGIGVRFTCIDTTLNIIFLGQLSGQRIVVRDLCIVGSAKLLSDDSKVELRQQDKDTAIHFEHEPKGELAYVVQVSLRD